MKTSRTTLSLLIGALFLFPAVASAEPASQPAGAKASADWPQYRGPNRDNVAVNSPRLLDGWPKEGPPLAWKSELIPGWFQGGCSGPVVADGKVFVYSTWKHPVGGGDLYKFITPEVLATWGWMPDLPADLAKKIEDARMLKGRPNCNGWPWWEIKEPKEKAKQLEDFLAKKPELDKYIKDFLTTLKPEDAKTYGDFIKQRLCITPWITKEGSGDMIWEDLEKLSKLQGVGYATCREWATKAWGLRRLGSPLEFHLGLYSWFGVAWRSCFTRSDVLVCLDATTGKTLWKKDFPLDSEAVANLKNSPFNVSDVLGICATPAVWNGKCYFAGAAGLYCVSAKDGALMWQVKRKVENASPLVVDGVVYQCGSAYDAETGRLLWKTKLISEGGLYGPTFMVFGGKTYIFTTSGASLYCLDLQTGKDIWTLKCSSTWTMEVQVSGDVLIAQGKMYKMTPAGLQPIKTLVDFPGMCFGLSWVIYQDHLYQYVFAGEGSPKNDKADGLCCWDLKGGDLQWAYRGPTCTWDTDYTPAILADGKIFASFGSNANFMSQNDAVAMYRATPEKYTLLGTFKPGLIPWTPMAFAGGKLFVRTELGISCYDLVQNGPYLDKTIVTKDNVTFVFKQTGGGLAAKDGGTGLKDVVVTDATGPAKPANPAKPVAAAKPAEATMAGDTIVVDIKDVPAPFGISYGAANSLAGKNGKPLPAFGWDEARVLKFRACFDNTIVLTSDLLLPQNGTWNAGATYAVAGATVTDARVDTSAGKLVTLTTDKTWKAGDAVTLTYPRFHVDQGEARRDTLTFTARGTSAAKFVKIDEATSGSWKGVYGAEGAVIVGDPAATAKCAVVTPSRCGVGVWAGSTTDARALQKSGEAKDRIAAKWSGGWERYIQIDVEITDGKEHQVALYCLDWDKNNGNKDGRVMTVEAWEPWRNVVLMDKQTVKEFTNGKYLVLNLKGHVALRLQIGGFDSAVVSGVFFDPPAPAGK